MARENVDVKSLIVLDRYLAILLESYPKPIRAAELAEKAKTSKSAITKIRERLLSVCDPKAMLFERGFVLSSDDGPLQSLFLVFAGTGRHRQFLSSKLVRRFVTQKALYPKIIKQFPKFETHFTAEDTEFMLTKILEATARIEPRDLQSFFKTYYFGKPAKLAVDTLPDISAIINKIQFKFKNQRDLQKTFVIRDKLFLFFRDSLWARIEKMDILDTLSSDERQFYIKTYKHTTDFYLKRSFEQLNEPLLAAAKNLGFSEKEIPVEIGSTVLVSGN